jgi:hypothetical protein
MADQMTGSDRQIARILEPIGLSLGLLVAQDQRVGAKVLYKDAEFVRAVRQYYLAVTSFKSDTTNAHAIALRNELVDGLSVFLRYVQKAFPKYKRGILTTLRGKFGGAFSLLYKNSLVLEKLLSTGLTADDGVVGPLVLPEQQSSPIYTKVEHDRVVLDSGHPPHPLLRKKAILETRRYLQRELAEIDGALKSSNVDRKYVEAFSRLSELIQFKDDAGAISFGLHVKMMSNLTSRIEEELSEVLNVQIAATLTHSAYFASQYKDWMEFVHNAQNYPPRDAIESRIEEALANVTEVLERNSVVVDERIPASIRSLLLMLSGSADDRTQAMYAGVRGVENFCIAAIKYSYEQAKQFAQDTASKARPALVTIGAGVLIMLTLQVISNFMPVIKNASELNWILENLPKIEKIGKILSK